MQINFAVSLFVLLLMYENAFAQIKDRWNSKSSLLLSYDLSGPLFGKANLPLDIRKNSVHNYFGPALGYEYGFRKRWVAGIKAGLLNEEKSTTTRARSLQTGADVMLNDEINESSFALSLYVNYFLFSNKRWQTYVGAGVGYKWVSVHQTTEQVSGSALDVKENITNSTCW